MITGNVDSVAGVLLGLGACDLPVEEERVQQGAFPGIATAEEAELRIAEARELVQLLRALPLPAPLRNWGR